MLKHYQFKNYNIYLLINVWILWCLGTIFINAAKPEYLIKQLLGVFLGSMIMITVSLIDYSVVCRFVFILYGINIILSILVKFIGKDVNGAKRWFNLGPIGTFQPSELTKIIMIVFVAVYIEKYLENFNQFKTLLKLAIYCTIPVGLIAILQPDLSTSLDICLILLCIIFVGGLSYKIIVGAVVSVIPLFILAMWYIQQPNQKLLHGYQLERIMAHNNPDAYKDSAALQQSNSVMAIGSGQLFGKGIRSDSLATVKDAKLVSEQQTDFIFSIVGEMWGFVGSMIVIALLVLVVVQCLLIARKAKDTSGMLIAAGMAALISIQSFINIGVATALLPNTGLPLPFISYGLSSLVSLSIGVGLVLNIGLQKRKY